MNARVEKRERIRRIFEVIMAEKFPKLMIDIEPQNQKAQTTLNRTTLKTT